MFPRELLPPFSVSKNKKRNKQKQAARCNQETICSSETSSSLQSKRRYIPEDSAFYKIHCFLERNGSEYVAV
jgi:hypothetical protein